MEKLVTASGEQPSILPGSTDSWPCSASWKPRGSRRRSSIVRSKAYSSELLETGTVPGELIPAAGMARGNFLTFRTDRAEAVYQGLHDQNVIVDRRGDRLRIGFGIYQDLDDVDRLARALSAF